MGAISLVLGAPAAVVLLIGWIFWLISLQPCGDTQPGTTGCQVCVGGSCAYHAAGYNASPFTLGHVLIIPVIGLALIFFAALFAQEYRAAWIPLFAFLCSIPGTFWLASAHYSWEVKLNHNFFQESFMARQFEVGLLLLILSTGLFFCYFPARIAWLAGKALRRC